MRRAGNANGRVLPCVLVLGIVGSSAQQISNEVAAPHAAETTQDDLLLEQDRIRNHGRRSELLQALVDTWLSPSGEGGHGLDATASTLPLSEAEKSLMANYTPASLPSYDYRSGCIHHAMYVKNCYASPKVISNMLAFDPGPTVIEYGSFLGEATFALHAAINLAHTIYGNASSTKIIALDTWREHQAYTSIHTSPEDWQPPTGQLGQLGVVPHPPAFYQFLVNLQESPALYDRVVPLQTEAQARAFGSLPHRPRLIYVNPPRHTAALARDLPILWRLLACGGTIGGAGYHVCRFEVDEFATSTPGARLEAFQVHAPGGRYEKDFPFGSSAVTAGRFHVNFTYWRIRNKSCSSSLSVDVGRNS